MNIDQLQMHIMKNTPFDLVLNFCVTVSTQALTHLNFISCVIRRKVIQKSTQGRMFSKIAFFVKSNNVIFPNRYKYDHYHNASVCYTACPTDVTISIEYRANSIFTGSCKCHFAKNCEN